MPHIDTLIAQAGRTTDPRTGAISTPIYQTATLAHPARGNITGFDYSRTTNLALQIDLVKARLKRAQAHYAVWLAEQKR